MVRKEQGDVKPGDEIEEENSRDEAVLRRDEVKDEQADAGHSLAESEPMLAEQFALEKIFFEPSRLSDSASIPTTSIVQ